jgi:hypothetical protein
MTLLIIGIMSVMTLFPQGYLLGTKSDSIGRAAVLLREELETQEISIMNPCNTVTAGTTSKNVYSSGEGSAQTGDVSYTVQTTITSVGTNVWRVNVNVAGAGGTPNIRESIIVTRQLYFIQGC